ncbi:hypothetical protein PU634_10340 [Oceanimonas pelagia]|uniref:Uncharacterized protein n=1 Tax=Oceanimonas pelagia TaxID=3028314 RepID=A0AA50KL95_9GAMM|nr:hypothetical protein [Oceanimonas pelagia]WMC09514.1 hypothetical protein PU634_10340 [Oceanimonas pelagia]
MTKKLLVETIGDITLMDMNQNAEIRWNRPTVVLPSPFISLKQADGQLRVLENDLDEKASDDEFAQFWAEHDDKDAAVANFLTSLKGAEKELEKPKKTTRKSAAKAEPAEE